MDWNVGSLQNADAQNNLQSQEVCYTQVLSNAHVLPQANAYPSENGCNYTGNNQMIFLPTNNINVAFVPVNVEGYKNSDQSFSGASVAGSSFATSEYSVDRCPPSHIPLATRAPNHASHVQAQMPQNPWKNSKAQVYSRRKIAPFPQMNSRNNVQNIPREPQNQYVATNGYTTRPPVPQLNSMRSTKLYQSSRNFINASKTRRLPSYNVSGPASSQGISVPINQPSGQYAHSQNNSLSHGTCVQHVQNEIYYPSNQFQVSPSQSQNNNVNVSLQQYVPSQMASDTHSGCSASPLLPANCDSRAAAQSLLGIQQIVQNVSNGCTLNQQKHPSDQKNASCFNSAQQYWQKQPSGEVGQSVRNVCNLSGNVTANQTFNEMSTSSPGISEVLYDIVQEIAKPPNDTASVQESQTPNLMNEPINNQMPSLTDSGRKVTKERLAWEAHKLLTIKKKCLLLEKMFHYKKKLLAASEPDKSTSMLTPCYQNTVPNFPSQVPDKNVAPSVSEMVRIGSQQHPIQNSSPGERNDKSMTNVDNMGLDMTPSNHQMDQREFSSSFLPVPAQSKLPTQSNNPERAPILEPKDVQSLISSQKTPTRSNNTSHCTQTASPFKMVGKNIPVKAGNSSFLQFVLSSTNILKEKKAGATADKILTSLLCNEKPPVGLMGSDGSLSKDTSGKNVEGLKDEQVFVVHTTPPVAMGSDEASFQKEVAQKNAPLTENSSSEQTNCTYSVEELNACLGLWRKHASEPVNVQNNPANESHAANPSSLPCTQNTTNNREQNNVSISTNEAVLPSTAVSLGQKHETVGSNLVKSFELQVAVVSPLVLSNQRTQSEEADKFLTSAGVTYPVIEAGSICSLLKEGENVLAVVNTEKETIETIPSSPDDCVLVEKVNLDLQQIKSADGNQIVEKSASASDAHDINQRQASRPVQDARDNLQLGLPDKSSLLELSVNSSSQIFQENIRDHKDKEAGLEQGNTSTTMLEDMIHISSVCSLVEGDIFYNPQIASMFNSAPVTNTLNNGSSLEDGACDPKQNEQQLGLYKDDIGLGENIVQEEGFLQTTLEELSGCTRKADKILDGITISSSEKASNGGSPKTLSTSEQQMPINTSCKHPENDFENLVTTNLELTQNSQDPSLGVSAETAMLSVTRGSSKKDYMSDINSTDESFEDSHLFGGEPLKCLNDQLTELVKEFPYGIEGADMLTKDQVQSDSVVECTTDQPQNETQTCNKSSDPVNQVQITLLQSEERQELFPEPDQHHYSESHKATSQQAEKDSSEKANLESNIQSGQRLCEEEEKTDKTSNPESEKGAYCCSMDWLSIHCADILPCSCKSSMSASEKTQSDQISEAENTTKETEESNNESASQTKMNSAMGNQPIETFQNSVGKNKKSVSEHTSVMNKETRTEVNSTLLAVQQDNSKPFNSSEKQDFDKLKRSSCKEELQIHKMSLLGKESHSAKKDHQNVSEEELSSGKGVCTDADNTTLPKKKKKICKETLSKDKTEIAVKCKTDIHKSKNSQTIEIKRSEVYQEHKNKNCEENTGKEENCRKQKDRLGKEVAVSIRGKVKLPAEINHKKLNSYRSDAIKFPNFSNADLKSRNHKYSQHKSVKALSSQDSSYKRKRKENVIGKKDPKKAKLDDERLKESEAKNSKQLLHNQMINTGRTKKSIGESVRKHKSPLTDHPVLKLQKKMGQSSPISKNCFSNKERHLDGQNKDKSSEKMFLDKNLLYLNRRNNRLKMYLQKEPKKHYLNRVAFRRTAQESIYLTKLETSPVRPVWHMKPKASRKTPDQKREASLSENEKSHKVLEFKLYPDILFKNPAPNEESSATKNTPERDKAVVAGVKSKKEDWLKYDPVKQRKREGTSAVEDSIPLDTAIQILEGDDEALHFPVKDSKDMFQTYRKMYLEKKCKTLDSIPVS
ncbi:retroelement silencing factor 1 [Eudromia elegans]